MSYVVKDILERLANSSHTESSHELQCRCFDAAEEISRLRAELLAANTPNLFWSHDNPEEGSLESAGDLADRLGCDLTERDGWVEFELMTARTLRDMTMRICIDSDGDMDFELSERAK